MPVAREPAELIYTWWERFLNAQSGALGGDREFRELSNKLDQVRSRLFGDGEITEEELDALAVQMEAVAALYKCLAERQGITGDAPLPATKEAFAVFREAAEIHFQTLAGDDRQHYRGGLLGQWTGRPDDGGTLQRIVLDLLTSASTPIALDKVHLIRAQLSLLGDGRRQRVLLDRVRDGLRLELTRDVWRASGRGPALTVEQFEAACRFESVMASAHVALPAEWSGTNRMLPNRPIAGRDVRHRPAVRALLTALASEGKLFLDRVAPSEQPVEIAIKLELNLGFEGAPSVSDPAVTYAAIAELLELGRARGLRLHFTVGDSNGIENAPFGRTSMDVLRETGHYHAALKAALEFAGGTGREPLFKLLALEQGSPPVYLGSRQDVDSTQQDLERVERAAAPWVRCVDYDVEGFRAIDPGLGPLATAVWGGRQFHVAEPWVAAHYRVHLTRGASNHVFAGWTGSLKGLVGLHALGGRPADLGMVQRGTNPLELLTAVMRSGGITGMFAARGGVAGYPILAAASEDSRCLAATAQSTESWNALAQFAAGREVWTKGVNELDAELRADQAAGLPPIELMAKMRRVAANLLARADLASPGFRDSLWQGVADGTIAFLLTMWRIRNLIPEVMRDERLGLRIGLLSRLPYQADLVVQGLPKIGLGGGPDAYFEARDVGIVVAGTDEISVDLTALRHAGVAGNPWAFNHPIHGALQFDRGPMCWEEICEITIGEASGAGA